MSSTYINTIDNHIQTLVNVTLIPTGKISRWRSYKHSNKINGDISTFRKRDYTALINCLRNRHNKTVKTTMIFIPCNN